MSLSLFVEILQLKIIEVHLEIKFARTLNIISLLPC